jgi:hypothetical protein
MTTAFRRFFSFMILYTVDRSPWGGGGSARHKASAYKHNNTDTE